MARPTYRLELDPGSYTYATEPGVDFQFTGRELAEKSGTPRRPDHIAAELQSAPFIYVEDGMWTPPETQHLLPILAQWSPTWFQSGFLAQTIFRKSAWTFGLSRVNVREYPQTDRPGAAYPDNQWMTFTVPAGASAVISSDFSGLHAFGIELPYTDYKIVAATTVSVANKSPYLQFVQQPPPDDAFIFGFGDIALVVSSGQVALIRSPNNNRAGWSLIGVWKGKQVGKDADYFNVTVDPGAGGIAVGESVKIAMEPRTVAIVPVGYDTLCVADGETFRTAAIRGLSGTPGSVGLPQIDSGPWWIAASPGMKVNCQVQTVRYKPNAEHGRIDDLADLSVTYFDFANYKPTIDPLIYTNVILHTSAALGTISLTNIPAGQRGEASLSGEAIEVQLIDENNHPWVSDGTHSKGALRIFLHPGDDPDTSAVGRIACVAPQLYHVQVQFPVKLVPRVFSTKYLTDADFLCKVEASLRDPFGKRLTVWLTDDGLRKLEALGIHDRAHYPVHLTCDPAGGSSFTQLCAAAWMDELEVEENIISPDDATKVQRFWELQAGGLIGRMENSPWLYTSQMTDPANGGRIEHTTAVRRTINQAGFDPADPARVFIATDTYPVQFRVLPGTVAGGLQEHGQRSKEPYAMEFDEGKASYIIRLGRDFRGWIFWESMAGLLIYQWDPQESFRDGGVALAPACTFYRTSDAAVANGKAPLQMFSAESKERKRKLISNWVIVYGTNTNGKEVAAVIDSEPDTVTNINNPLFVGEWIPTRIQMQLTSGAGLDALKRIARFAIRRLCKAPRERTWTSYMPPWETLPNPMDVGRRCTLDGIGDYIVTHIESLMIGPGIWETTYTGERPEASAG